MFNEYKHVQWTDECYIRNVVKQHCVCFIRHVYNSSVFWIFRRKSQALWYEKREVVLHSPAVSWKTLYWNGSVGRTVPVVSYYVSGCGWLRGSRKDRLCFKRKQNYKITDSLDCDRLKEFKYVFWWIFVGYVAVCVQLYCRGKLSLFHTTCFGLYGHLQVCRMLLLSCSWRNPLRWFMYYVFWCPLFSYTSVSLSYCYRALESVSYWLCRLVELSLDSDLTPPPQEFKFLPIKTDMPISASPFAWAYHYTRNYFGKVKVYF
jgi:hypothetical protein